MSDPPDTYGALVDELRDGARFPEEVLQVVCAEAGRSLADLAVDVLTARGAPRSGDPCSHCSTGRLRVANVVRRGEHTVRYLACGACGFRPEQNKIIRPAEGRPGRATR